MKKFTALILATILMFNFAFVVHAAEEVLGSGDHDHFLSGETNQFLSVQSDQFCCFFGKH